MDHSQIPRAPTGGILSATVVREASGAYHVSPLCEADDLEPWPVPESAPARARGGDGTAGRVGTRTAEAAWSACGEPGKTVGAGRM